MQTSTTNIGAYLWSGVAAERLGIIGHRELVRRLSPTVTTLEGMERHAPDGQFYNWYDHRDGAKLTTWPPTGEPLDPILSSVDNAWLATGLRSCPARYPSCPRRVGAIYDAMDFGLYYVPDKNRILFHYSPAEGTGPCCYDTVVSESRIADYIGIAKGDLPRKEYYGRWRTFPDTCDYSFQEQKPTGFHRTYDGVDVYDGAYAYGGRQDAQLGRVDVRGADAVAVRARGALGRRLVAAEPPATPSTPRSTTGCGSPGTACGASRPRTPPRAGTAPTVSTWPAWTPTGCPPTRTPRSWTTGSPAARTRPGARPARAALHQRRGHPPRRVPRAPLPTHAATGRPRPARGDARDVREVGVPRLGQRDHRKPSGSYLSLDQGMVMAALGNALGDDVMRRTS